MSLHRPTRRNSAGLFIRAFTLTELLVLVAVMGIMAGVGMPALLSSAKGSRVTHAGNTLADMASLARQISASGNAMVAMVLVTNEEIMQNRGRAIGLFEFGADRKWKQSVAWTYLPEEITAEVQSSSESSKKLSDAKIILAGNSLTETDYAALIFFSDGRMDGDPDTAPKIRAYSPQEGGAHNYYDIVFNTENSVFSISRP